MEEFFAGNGCSIELCGTSTDDGVALQVIQGEAVIKGGTFEGNLYNYQGIIELHGCLYYSEDKGNITGILLDGSNMNVVYEQPANQNIRPVIVYLEESCPEPSLLSSYFPTVSNYPTVPEERSIYSNPSMSPSSYLIPTDSPSGTPSKSPAYPNIDDPDTIKLPPESLLNSGGRIEAVAERIIFLLVITYTICH